MDVQASLEWYLYNLDMAESTNKYNHEEIEIDICGDVESDDIELI